MRMKQFTLKRPYSFEGKGLHTGCYSRMTILPAPVDTGIMFERTDLGEKASVEAVAENVTNTTRSTTISKDGVTVVTIEHLMSALYGLGVDNAIIRIDNAEVPILDGSAAPYIRAIVQDGLQEQDAERHYITIDKTVEIRDEKTGSYIIITPSDKPHFDITVDFSSKVLGVQSIAWSPEDDYCSQIGPCRTFVFFHELEFLFRNNLIKGGDMDNAIVIVEHPVTEEQIDSLCSLFGKPKLSVTAGGYLSNLDLHFPDECGRHKLLDLIGDLYLCGGRLLADIKAFKPGHTLNTNAAKAVRAAITSK